MDLINGRPTGAVRISFGYMSTILDARACLRFIADSFLENPTPIPQFPDPVWYRKDETADVGLNESKHSTKTIKDESKLCLVKFD